MTAKRATKKLERFFNELKTRACNFVRGRIWKVAPTPDDAFDILQEAMIDFTQYAHKPEQEWSPIFHGILEHKISDYFRRHARDCKLINAVANSALLVRSGGEVTPETACHAAKIAEIAKKIITKLPPQQQQIYYLTQIEYLSICETANILGIAPGTVKKHRFDAMTTLRKKLGPYLAPHAPSSRRHAAMRR